MNACVDILYEHAGVLLGYSREDYERTLVGWDLTPIVVDSEVVGAVMEKGNVIHIAVRPQAYGRWARTGIARRHLVAGIEKHGFMTTSVSPVDSRAIEFVERLGFYFTGINGLFFRYRIDHAKIR